MDSDLSAPDGGVAHVEEGKRARIDGDLFTRAGSAALVLAWFERAAAAIDRHSVLLDALNVFPIADSDTGSNLATTLRAARAATTIEPGGRGDDVLREVARGALFEARGNSGMLLALWLDGFANGAGSGIEAGFSRGAEAGRTAVAEPAPGTFLTIADHVAHAGTEVAVPAAVQRLRATLWSAVMATRDQLPVAPEASEIDSGAWGLAEIVDALLVEMTGIDAPPPERDEVLLEALHRAAHLAGAVRPDDVGNRATARATDGEAEPVAASRPLDVTPDGPDTAMIDLEIVAIIEPRVGTVDATLASLRPGLARLGTSLVLTGLAPHIALHIHVETRDEDRVRELLARHGCTVAFRTETLVSRLG